MRRVVRFARRTLKSDKHKNREIPITVAANRSIITALFVTTIYLVRNIARRKLAARKVSTYRRPEYITNGRVVG